MNGCKFLGAQDLDVFFEGAQALRILLDEVRGRRTTRESFESQGARAGIEIEHSRFGKIELQDAHPGFANAIKRRPNRIPLRCADAPSPPPPSDYSHAARTSAMRACR